MKTKAKNIRTTRQQRGLYLAASGVVNPLSSRRYRVKEYLVTPSLNHCTCYDAQRGHTCKHQIAVRIVHQHGELSLSLAMIMAAGGGHLVQQHKGGLGKYWRLEGNILIDKPLPVAHAFDSNGTERLYPAAIVDPGRHQFGYDLIALTNPLLAKEYAADLYKACRVTSVAYLRAALTEYERRSAAAKERKQCKQQKLRKAA